MRNALQPYPAIGRQRDLWILDRRPPRAALDPFQPYAFLVEEERSALGDIVPTATIFLTNRECPWRCLMCDLWRNTFQEKTPVGAIPAQIRGALAQLPFARQIKLYNSGSFFDSQAIPLSDLSEIASLLSGFERIIVESHPALLGESCLRLRDLLSGRLEVAVGLETAHPEILERLNKRMTLDQFSTAAAWLRTNEIDLRAFILVQPPFMDEHESVYWAERSLDFAFDVGAGVSSLIPTRSGNGALEDLEATGQFLPPKIYQLEACMHYGLDLKAGRVFVDLWDLERFASCQHCYAARAARLHRMNLQQRNEPFVSCLYCGSAD